MKKISASILFAFACSGLTAQDVHFSQFNETPQLLNPATTGVYNGYVRGTINYRNQWADMGNAFTTTAVSVDIPMFDYKERKAHLGLGLNFFKDKAGDANFGLTQVNLCLAGIIPMNATSKFSMGVSLGSAQYKANLQSLSWESQYNGDGFNSYQYSNESTPVNSDNYADLGAGIFYEYFTGKTTVQRKEQRRFGIGLACYHINRPTQKFFSMNQQLYRKYVVNVNGHFDKTGSKISILPSAILFRQGPSTEFTFGCGLRYRIRDATKITGFYSETGLALAIHYRVGDAIIPSLSFEMKGFTLGVSYDYTLSTDGSGSMKNGYEFALRYNIDKGAVFKRKGRG